LNYGNEIECFYFERGIKFEVKSFASQTESIEYFKQWVLSNETLRINWGGVVGKP